MANSSTIRLKNEYMNLKQDPVHYVAAEPLPRNIYEWHFVISGPENTPYEGGKYHGKLIFPSDYPFKPPSIYMITPNGRFQTNVRLCLSVSDLQPQNWSPAWSISTILTGLISFMTENTATWGSLKTSESDRRSLAEQSLAFNLRDRQFCELFPDVVETIKAELEKRKEEHEINDEEVVESTKKSRGWFSSWFSGWF